MSALAVFFLVVMVCVPSAIGLFLLVTLGWALSKPRRGPDDTGPR